MKRSKSILILVAIISVGLTQYSCSEKTDLCDDISCLNEGTCEDGICDCPEGFTGPNCGTEDLCITQNLNCLNGGVCINGACDCPDGFTGDRCEIEDRCITQNIDCLNGGVCDEGECDCPDGFIGDRCEQVDFAKIQDLLNSGYSPKTLYDAGVPLDQLYGKTFEQGLIFYLNTTTGSGLLAHNRDMTDFRGDRKKAKWGCANTDIPNLPNVSDEPANPETEDGARIGDGEQNTIAILASCGTQDIGARLCRDLGDEYFLPSRGELNAMRINLYQKGHGGFAEELYMSSSEVQYNSAWVQNMRSGATDRAYKEAPVFYVRAVKSF